MISGGYPGYHQRAKPFVIPKTEPIFTCKVEYCYKTGLSKGSSISFGST